MPLVVGNKERLFAELTDIDEEPVDPTIVTFAVKTPGGVTTSYIYGTAVEVIRTGTGLYYMDILLDEEGDWIYSCDASGSVKGYKDKGFHVEPSGMT